MRPKPARPELLGSFQHADALLAALHQAAHASDVEILDVYSPVPDHHILEFRAPQKSPVRFFTFMGGLCGLAGGMALTILTSLIWNLIVFGKPVTNVTPFLVVGFEGTILLGAVGTLIGLLWSARLPFFEFPSRAYRPQFTEDRFGVWLSCPRARLDEVREMLHEAGATDVEDVAAAGEEARP